MTVGHLIRCGIAAIAVGLIAVALIAPRAALGQRPLSFNEVASLTAPPPTHHIAYGAGPPSVSYDGLNYIPSCYNIPLALSNAIDNGTVKVLPGIAQPSSPEYISVKGMMNSLQEMVSTASFKDEVVTSTSVNVPNKQLLKRLWQ